MPQRPLRPWENLEVFPLAQELVDTGGPPDGSERGLLGSSSEEALFEDDDLVRGPPAGPAAARLPKGEFR